MDLITIGTTAAIAVPTIAAVALYMDRRTLRKRITVLNRRVGYAEDLHVMLAEKIEKLECQAASDGNRLSELRTENAELKRSRDGAHEMLNKASREMSEAEAECAALKVRLDALRRLADKLEPLAEIGRATQAQRAAALEKAKAANRAAKARRAQAA